MAGGPDVLTIISNAAFFLPASKAAQQRHWTMTCVYLLIIVCSSIYHTCNSFHGMCLGLPPHVPRFMDFFFAQLVIPLTALYVIELPDVLYWVKRVAIVTFGFAIFLLLQYFETSLTVQIALAGISFALIFVYWAVYASIYKKLPDYRWDYFCLAIGLTALSSSLFVVQLIMPRFYWAIHSVWHVNAAFGQYFLLLIWPEKDPERLVPAKYVALDKQARYAPRAFRRPTAQGGWRGAVPTYFNTLP